MLVVLFFLKISVIINLDSILGRHSMDQDLLVNKNFSVGDGHLLRRPL